MKNKKQIIINIAIAIIFFILGGIFGSKMENSRLNSIRNAIPNNSTQEKPKEELKKEAAKIIPLNQEENLGNAGMKVLSVEEKEKISNESGNSTASGKFVVIELSLKNNDKQPIQYQPNQFELITNDDVIYQIDDNAFEAMGNLNSQETIFNENKEFIGVYDKFNAGMTKKTYIVFEVPKELNLDNTKLVVSGNKSIQFSLK